MIAEDVQRKIWLGGLIGAVILGVLFLLWAVVLNRSSIIMHARAPYSITVQGLKTENCATDECTVVVAPGDYTITLQKTGYKSLTKTVTVPLGSPYSDNILLQFIPVFGTSTLTEEDIFPADPELGEDALKKLGITSSTKLFFADDKKTFSYIVRNDLNFRQTLYLAVINDKGEVGEPQIVTSFLRDLGNYVVAISPKSDKIAVIDQAPGQATLYMIDREAKNRASLLTYSAIRDMRWLPDSDDFIFQAREKNDSPEFIYLYRWDDGKTTQLELRTPLDTIAVVNKDRLLAVTNQALPEGAKTRSFEGQLVPLGENQSTLEVSAGILAQGGSPEAAAAIKPAYSFVDYSLIANQARLIGTLNEDPFPSRIKAADDAKSIYFLQGEKVGQLTFEE